MRMGKLRIYLESTLFNRYFEPERDNYGDTRQLFNEIQQGKFEAYTSQYVIDELANAQEPKRQDMLNLMAQYPILFFEKSEAADALAQLYADHKIISEKHIYDRLHISCAAVNNMDAIVSLNFTHINRLSTKEKTELVNRLNGYRAIQIVSPMEVISYEDK